MNRKQLGELGERIAEKYLTRKGYKILDRNFQKRFYSGPLIGEIDLIVQKGNLISFVEVKTLSEKDPFLPARPNFAQQNFGGPEQKVNLGKRKKIAKIAQIWLQKQNIPLNTEWGIDVIAITISPKGARVKHFKNIDLT